jgi:Stress responsive A/B Barrel Domain
MFIHAVYFWLRPDLTADQQAQFHAGVQALITIETIQQAYVGTPAPTDRPVIERGYSAALIVIFADQSAHDHYQVHPIHDQFREQCSTLWEKVLIYDTIA